MPIKYGLLIALLMGLNGCTTAPADTSRLSLPPASLMAPVKPLPDVPDCSEAAAKSPEDFARCRAQYDAPVREQYANTGDRYAALQSWVRKLLARQP